MELLQFITKKFSTVIESTYGYWYDIDKKIVYKNKAVVTESLRLRKKITFSALSVVQYRI